MALVAPNEGEVFLIERALNKKPAVDLRLRLYTNDVTPIETHIFGDYTEASGFGYSGVTLSGTSWTIASGTTATYPQQTFTFTGALGSVYGYYVTGGTSLVWAERFTNGPYNVQNNGDTIKITTRLEFI